MNEHTAMLMQYVMTLFLKETLFQKAKLVTSTTSMFFFSFTEGGSRIPPPVQNRQVRDVCHIYSKYTPHDNLLLVLELPTRSCERGKPDRRILAHFPTSGIRNHEWSGNPCAHWTDFLRFLLFSICLQPSIKGLTLTPLTDTEGGSSLLYLPSILLTQPWLTRSCREMSHGRTPWWASSTILWRTTSGRGRPFTKTPPS